MEEFNLDNLTEKELHELATKIRQKENKKLSEMTDEQLQEYIKKVNDDAANFAKEYGIEMVSTKDLKEDKE
ncbi:MAG: hypothetical protein ACOX6H_04570 [Christensenellales bacterium]|jgi:rRNA pseudouridine-1189 N-methylase Emg1 (Nep1/Mra1 family)